MNERKEINNSGLALKKEDLYFRYNTISNWIKVADNKVSIALAIIGLISSSFLGISINNINNDIVSNIKSVAQILISISISFLVITILECLRVFIPRLFTFGNNEKGKNSLSTIFYGDIVKFGDCETYYNKLRTIDNLENEEQLIENIYINAKICDKKMKHMKYASWLMILTVILSATSLIITLFC